MSSQPPQSQKIESAREAGRESLSAAPFATEAEVLIVVESLEDAVEAIL
jgi:hypothetical protein